MRSEAALRRPDRGGDRADPAELAALAERVRPVTLTREQRLPVLPSLEGLLPGAGLRRGATVWVGAAAGVQGTTSLALALVAEASRAGSWVAAVGVPSLGLVAADELGVALERLVLVAAPERDAWGGVVAALVDGFDVVVLQAGRGGVRTADARRLVARARERGAVLVQLGPGWPDGADLTLQITHARWEGIDAGHGHLRARKVRVVRSGRGEAAQPRRADLWLPGSSGEIELVDPVTVAPLRAEPVPVAPISAAPDGASSRGAPVPVTPSRTEPGRVAAATLGRAEPGRVGPVTVESDGRPDRPLRAVG